MFRASKCVDNVDIGKWRASQMDGEARDSQYRFGCLVTEREREREGERECVLRTVLSNNPWSQQGHSVS